MDTNRFYKISNPKDQRYQYTDVYINLDDISSVEYPNESLKLGRVNTKTGKEIYVQKDELDKIINLLNVINITMATFLGKPVSDLSPEERLEFVKSQTDFVKYE